MQRASVHTAGDFQSFGDCILSTTSTLPSTGACNLTQRACSTGPRGPQGQGSCIRELLLSGGRNPPLIRVPFPRGQDGGARLLAGLGQLLLTAGPVPPQAEGRLCAAVVGVGGGMGERSCEHSPGWWLFHGNSSELDPLLRLMGTGSLRPTQAASWLRVYFQSLGGKTVMLLKRTKSLGL